MKLPSRIRALVNSYPSFTVFFCVSFVSICFLLLNRHGIHQGFGDYEASTHALIDGHPFYGPTGFFLDDYPPVQPLILALQNWIAELLGISRIWVMLVCWVAIFGYTAVVLFKTTVLLHISRAAGFCLALVYANPLTLKLLTLPASENIYMLFLALSVAAFVNLLRDGSKSKMGSAVWAGIWFGLGWITRPISLFLPFCAVAILLLFSKNKLATHIKASVMMILFAFIVVLPWQVFTYKESGKFHFLSSRGINGLRDGLSYNSDAKTFRTKFDLPGDIDAMLKRFQADYEDYKTSSQVFDFLKKEFNNNPGTVISYYMIKAGRVWYGTDAHRLKEEKIIRLITFPFFFIYFLSIVYFTRHRNKYPLVYKTVLFTLLSTLSVWALATIATSIVRYMIPMMMIDAIPAGFIVYKIVQRTGRLFASNPGAATA